MGVASEMSVADIKYYLEGQTMTDASEDIIQQFTDQTGVRPQWVISPETAAKHLELREGHMRKYIRALLVEANEEVLKTTAQVQPESQIFCDMDGVLVNFEDMIVRFINGLLGGGTSPGIEITKGYEKRLAKVREELGPNWRAKDRPDLDIKSVRNFMMGAVGANPGLLFAEMKPHLDALEKLWPFLTGTGRTVNVLTAEIRAREGAIMSAAEGKELWIHRWLKPQPSQIIMSPAKQKARYATTNGIPNILIDDKLTTVDSWNAAGGIGIWHMPGGSADTVEQLKELGV
jgi:hypothetical protein